MFGGSFDPPHRGHAQLLYSAMVSSWARHAYVVPAFQQVLKGGHYSDINDRLAMLTLTFSVESPFSIIISDVEAKANRAVPTWEVLDHFQALHPDHEVLFLAGDDCLADFPLWQRADYLTKTYRFLVGKRLGTRALADPARMPTIEVVPVKHPDTTSSSRIRELLMDGKSVDGYVNPMVAAYIKEHALYGPVERVDLTPKPCGRALHPKGGLCIPEPGKLHHPDCKENSTK